VPPTPNGDLAGEPPRHSRSEGTDVLREATAELVARWCLWPIGLVVTPYCKVEFRRLAKTAPGRTLTPL
jgi:hypothetical protein